MRKVILREGKEKALKNRHPWIFSGAIENLPDCEPGEILPVFTNQGEFIAQAYFHPHMSLVGRVLSFSQANVEMELRKRIAEALRLRKKLFDPKSTNAYRLINAESDGIPGLVVDNYDGHLVMQSSTCGIERLKPILVQILIEEVQPRAIYEKSLSASRKEEGLSECEKLVFGEDFDEVEILENSHLFAVSIKQGQKTGFFLDQREMRSLVGKMASHLKVLNCFGYTGGFSIYALKNNAAHVTTVDRCATACQFAEKNTQINQIPASKHQILQTDVFHYLSTNQLDYDLIILDPPAFAKKRKDIEAACRGYLQLNQMTIEKMPSSSYLLTASCSNPVDAHLFQKLIFEAARNAKRNVRILQYHTYAPDHPLSLYHPEGAYLKSLFLYVE